MTDLAVHVHGLDVVGVYACPCCCSSIQNSLLADVLLCRVCHNCPCIIIHLMLVHWWLHRRGWY